MQWAGMQWAGVQWVDDRRLGSGGVTGSAVVGRGSVSSN